MLLQPCFFFVRALESMGNIVASPSCTAYLWGSLIVFYDYYTQVRFFIVSHLDFAVPFELHCPLGQ